MATPKTPVLHDHADTAPASTKRPSEQVMEQIAKAEKSSSPKRERKPAQTVTMPAAQAKRIAKALQGYAKHLHGTGNTADARRYAETASVLEIAAEYGDKATS